MLYKPARTLHNIVWHKLQFMKRVELMSTVFINMKKEKKNIRQKWTNESSVKVSQRFYKNLRLTIGH